VTRVKLPDRRTWPCRLMGHDKTHWWLRRDGSIYCGICARVVRDKR
jgi:hypothetical protein